MIGIWIMISIRIKVWNMIRLMITMKTMMTMMKIVLTYIIFHFDWDAGIWALGILRLGDWGIEGLGYFQLGIAYSGFLF